MDKHLTSLLLFAAIAAETSTAFVAPKVHSSAPREIQANGFERTTNAAASSISSLSLSSSPDDNSSGSDSFLKARTDIRNFLTQRSIQSFVYLLNQCREEHTVRWLEKTLDFTSIDNFHGTGAFNQTMFPEWDSIFLDCVDRPEEVMVMQIRQRRRQRKLSGHNDYFESLKRPPPPTEDPSPSVSSASTSDIAKPKTDDETKGSAPTRTFFSSGNYLDAMKKPATPASKKTEANQKPSRRLSSASSYLENLSAPKASSSLSRKSNGKKTSSKDEGMVIDEKSSSKDDPKKISSQRRTFGPGKSSNYLESLATSTTASASTGDGSKETKQSTETSRNPFLEEKTKEYELSVDPPALVRRILSVREQLSKEWVEDLDMLVKLNDEIAESFEEYNNKVEAKDDEEEDDEEEDDEDDEDDTDIQSLKSDAEDEEEEKNLSDLDALIQALTAPTYKDPTADIPSTSSKASSETTKAKMDDIEEEKPQTLYDEQKPESVFDRKMLSTWSQLLWSPKRSSSPYRKANFDLLLLLATQESIHRVMKSYKNDGGIRSETHEWLLDFYTDNVNDYFDGHQTNARSEDFLEKMMKESRSLIETNGEILAWVDPARIAEDIVRERSEVTLDWMKVAETIPDEHTDLRRLLFTNMVSKSFPEDTLSDTILSVVKNEAEEDSSTSSPTEVFGAFE